MSQVNRHVRHLKFYILFENTDSKVKTVEWPGYNRLISFNRLNFVPQDRTQRHMIEIPENILFSDPNFHKVASVNMPLVAFKALLI